MEDCHHERKEFRKITHAKGFHKVLQCIICGARIKNNASVFWPHQRGDESLKEQDHKLYDAYYRKRGELWKLEYESKKKADLKEKHRKYDTYINSSPEWKERRALVMIRSGWKCEACLKARATQVHHENYDTLFDEVCWDLRAVCKECHLKIHTVKFSMEEKKES